MTPPRWLDDDEQAAWRGLLAMTAGLQAALGRHLSETAGLSLPDYDVLVRLSEAGDEGLRLAGLSAALDWEQSRTSHHVSRMVRRGLLARQECADDRRGAFVVLAPAGREALEAAAPAHVEEVRRLVFDALTPAQVASLREVADAVTARLAPGSR